MEWFPTEPSHESAGNGNSLTSAMLMGCFPTELSHESTGNGLAMASAMILLVSARASQFPAIQGSVSQDFQPQFFSMIQTLCAPDKQAQVFLNSVLFLQRYYITKFEKINSMVWWTPMSQTNLKMSVFHVFVFFYVFLFCFFEKLYEVKKIPYTFFWPAVLFSY